jgi:hypothetical protein
MTIALFEYLVLFVEIMDKSMYDPADPVPGANCILQVRARIFKLLWSAGIDSKE